MTTKNFFKLQYVILTFPIDKDRKLETFVGKSYMKLSTLMFCCWEHKHKILGENNFSVSVKIKIAITFWPFGQGILLLGR